jgi:hypothetical protein
MLLTFFSYSAFTKPHMNQNSFAEVLNANTACSLPFAEYVTRHPDTRHFTGTPDAASFAAASMRWRSMGESEGLAIS